MKQIFRKNYKILTILLILILAAGCLMLTACSGSSGTSETNTETSAKNKNAFFEAVEKLPSENKLEYGHKSSLENAKKKYDALTANDGANHKETLNDAEKRYVSLTEYVFSAKEEDEDARHNEILKYAKQRYDILSEKEKLTEKEDQELMLSAEIAYKNIYKEFSEDFIMIESAITIGKGLLGIFLVMGIIIGGVFLLNLAGNRKKGNMEEI